MLSFGSFARRPASVAGVLVMLSACTSSPSTVQVRTDGRLRVTPQEFTYDVGCSFASGSDSELGHYVATLLDLGTVDAGAKPELRGSATAARCTSSTTFSTTGEDSLVEVGHRYAVIIDGYVGTTPPKVDGERPGKWASPNWQWLCGIGGLPEAQLQELLTEAQRLARVQLPIAPTPLPMVDAAVTTAPPTGEVVADAAVTPSDASIGTASNATVTPSDVNAPDAAVSASTDSAPDAAAVTVSTDSTPDAVVTASTDSTPDAAVTASTGSTPDAAAVTVSTDSTSAVATASDTTSTPNTSAETGEAGEGAWLAALVTAADDDDFAPPAKVVAGGQSGLRGCVPLF